MSEEKVRVRFITAYDEFRVPDTPFAVPTKLGRSGLSEVINHLLDREIPQPFDFLIENKLVRAALSKCMLKWKLSREEVVTIEYLPAMTLSDEVNEAELPSWVGAIETESPGRIFAGCYDGQVKVLDSTTLNEQFTVAAHAAPIRAVKVFSCDSRSHADPSPTLLATASKDQLVNCWLISGETATKIGQFEKHANSVESLAFCAPHNLLVSGDWNGNILAWDVSDLLDKHQQSSSQEDGSHRKKLKRSKGQQQCALVSDMSPLFVLRAHAQAITDIQYVNGQDCIATASWDHSIKLYHMESQDCIATFAGSKVVTSLDISQNTRLLCSSHPDGKVRVWDTRQREETTTVEVLGSSANSTWVAQARWHPTSSVLLSSADYEGKVRVWDIRANSVPIGSYSAHDGKALCVDWLSVAGDNSVTNDSAVVKVCSGGSDNCVKCVALAM